MEYASPVLPPQIVLLPEIERGVPTTAFTTTFRHEAVLTEQPLPAVTQILPLVVPLVTLIVVVPAPAVMDHPEGSVQL